MNKSIKILSLFLSFALMPLTGFSEVKSHRIVFLGDSISAGYGVTKEQAYPTLLETLLINKGYKVEISNVSISGSTSASLNSRIKWVMRKPIDLLVIGLGGNDGLRGFPISATKENLVKAIKFAKEKDIKVLLLGMKLPDNYGEEYQKNFYNMFSEIAREQTIPLMPFLLKDVGGIQELNLNDRIHPNADGHKIIANNILPYIESALK
ncbi:MAG: arylesterase [Bdellovibrionales bacterium]